MDSVKFVAELLARVTMGPARLRQLAAAHRTGFELAAPGDVALNSPYLGSQEIIAAGARFAELQSEAESRRIALDAVQAEFLREYLIGLAGTAQLMRPGRDWPPTDPRQVDRIARRCMRSWDLYRAS